MPKFRQSARLPPPPLHNYAWEHIQDGVRFYAARRSFSMGNGVVSNAAVTPKVAVSGIAGSLIVILLWILGLFHVTVPAEVASAMTVIVSFVAGYIAPRSSPPDPPEKPKT